MVESNGRGDGAQSDAMVNEADSDACTALERWFGNGQSVLGHVARITRGATSPRFDIETMELFIRAQLPSRSREPERAVRVAFGWDEKGALPEMNVRVERSAITTGASRLALREIDVQRDRDAQSKTVQAYMVQAVGDAYAALDREWRRR